MTRSLKILLLSFTLSLCGLGIAQNQSTENNLSGLQKDEQTASKTFPKHPKIGKDYKFLAYHAPVHYVVIFKRTNDSTLEFRTDDSVKDDMRYGQATLNPDGGERTEQSVVTGRAYTAYAFVETKDSLRTEIRVGIDSIGSGDRLLLRFIEKINGEVVTDLNMAN